MNRSAVCFIAFGVVVSCVLPSVELDSSLGAAGAGASGNTTSGGSSGGKVGSSGGGKVGSSSGGSGAPQGATGAAGSETADGGDDSSAGGGASTSGGQGGVAGSGGSSAGLAGASGDGGSGGASKDPPIKSTGCDKPATVTAGKKTIMIGSDERSFAIDIPSGYDMSQPHRLFYASHWILTTADAVVNEGFYYLKPKAVAANEPAIFIAPQGLPGNPSGSLNSGEKDHALFEGIVAFAKENLCIDEARVFAIGFSMGAMYTYSLSRNQQSTLRAAVGIAPANYNIYLPPQTGQRIAWMQTTGLSDNTCKWVNSEASMTGAKFVALEHAANNHCTIPAVVPVWEQGPYLCYNFEGCDAGYPTRACTFNGAHVSDSGPTSSTSWISQEAWNFFMQF